MVGISRVDGVINQQTWLGAPTLHGFPWESIDYAWLRPSLSGIELLMVELCRWKDSWKQPPGLQSHGVTSVKGVYGIPGLLDTMGYDMSSGFLLKSHLSIVRTLYHSQHQLGCQPHTQPVALPEASQVRGLPCLELKPVRLALQYIYIYIIYTISMYIYIPHKNHRLIPLESLASSICQPHPLSTALHHRIK